MKHKTWFRLIIRAIGVWVLATAIPSAASSISRYVTMFFDSSVGTTNPYLWQSSYYLPELIRVGLQLGLGFYLLFGGDWIINKCIPSNRPYCPDCGYDLSHNSQAANCPECGVTLPMKTIN